MKQVDYIFDLLDWNKSLEEQAKGIELAKSIDDIVCFFQPTGKEYNKNVWGNCAIIVSQKDDATLSKYLIYMLEWLQDMNWPGAQCIFERLCLYSDVQSLGLVLNECISKAKETGDDDWLDNLERFCREINIGLD